MVLVGLLLMTPASILSAEYGFEVTDAKIFRSENGYDLNAGITYDFSPRAIEALNNGVPLTVVVEVRVHRYRRFVWNKTLVKRKFIYRLTYHALPRRFRLYDQNQDRYRNFVNMRAALQALGKIRETELMKHGDIEPGNVYTAELKTYLDIEALPLPLRSIAYVIPQWYMSSTWYKWPLEESNPP